MTLATPDKDAKESAAAKIFEASHPGVRVVIDNGLADYPDKIVTMIVGGSSPDVIYDAARMHGALQDHGVLQDLTPYIKATPGFDLQDFYPGIMAAFTQNGRVYALPRGNQPDVLFYDEVLFDGAGVAPPNEDWTWDDQMRTAVMKFTQDKNGDGTYETYGFGAHAGFYWPLVWDSGGSFLDSTDSHFLLDQPAGVQGLETAVELMRPRYAANGWGNTNGDFLDHKLALRQANGTTMAWLIGQGATQGWNIAPLPGGPAGNFTLVDGAGYAIPINAPHPKLAWEFINLLTSVDGLTRIMESGPPGTVGTIPTRRSVALGPDFLGVPVATQIHRQVLLEALGAEHARVPYVAGVYWQQISGALDKALTPVWTGAAAVKTALEGVGPQIDGILQQGD